MLPPGSFRATGQGAQTATVGIASRLFAVVESSDFGFLHNIYGIRVRFRFVCQVYVVRRCLAAVAGIGFFKRSQVATSLDI